MSCSNFQWLLCSLVFFSTILGHSQASQQRMNAEALLQQKEEALELIRNGEKLVKTPDEHSSLANAGRGGRISNAAVRQRGKGMIARGRQLLVKTNSELRNFTQKKRQIEAFLQGNPKFENWESADGRQVEAAMYQRSAGSVTLVRRDGLVFSLEKHQLADKHHHIFGDENPSHQASLEIAQEIPSTADRGNKSNPSQTREVMEAVEADLPSIKECINQMVLDLSAAFSDEEISALGVSRFYINGSSLNDRSPTYLFQILESLLTAGEFDVFDRSSLSVVMGENKLQYLVSGKSDTFLEAGEAIIVGNLLYTENCSEAFITIRAIETGSSKVLFARTARARISEDEMAELGLVYRDMTTDKLPRIRKESEEKLLKALERADGKATGFSIVFDTPKTEDLPMWSRIGYFEAIEMASSAGLILFDRDLLLTLFEEAGLDSEEGQLLTFGDALISLKPEEISDSGALSVKIYNRENSALFAIAKLEFLDGSEDRVDKPWDDSFSAALKHMNKRTELSADDLKFEATFKLDSYSENQAESFRNNARENNLIPDVYELSEPGSNEIIRYGTNGYFFADGVFSRSQLRIVFGDITSRLVVITKNEQQIKRALISLIMVGFYQNRTVYVGILPEVGTKIADTVTTSKEGEALKDKLFRKCMGFAEAWSQNDDLPYEGKFSEDGIKFKYAIDFRFKGIYPKWVTLKIDLTPMKDQLFKVIKDENKRN